MKSEPAALVGAASSVVAAVVTALVAFGIELTPEQQAAVLGVAAAVLPFLAGIVTRAYVTPWPRESAVVRRPAGPGLQDKRR